MKRSILAGAFLIAGCGAALAQTVSGGPGSAPRPGANAAIGRLLSDGFEVKAAFAEAGIAYVILQKQTSAYLCMSGGAATCEKLN